MNSLQHPTTMENLPCEILLDIFIRLFAKQLAQMRSVCKPWNALLSESSFVKSHLHHSIHNNDEILLFIDVVSSLDRKRIPFAACRSCSPDLELELTNFIKLPLNLQYKCGYITVIGSVNGLICFYYASYHGCDYLVHIWNPFLPAVLTLPPCPVIPHKLDFGFGFDPKTDNYKIVPHKLDSGFGFDPKTDNYKIVKLVTFFQTPDEVLQGEVYSMRMGSWESISQSFPSHISIVAGHNNQVCVDGRLHLCDIDLKWRPETIVAFDLGAETFSVIPLPDFILNPHEDRLNVLGVLSGKLYVMACVEDGECEVWVMDAYGVADSWVKHQAFPPFSGNIEPYGFTSHNEFFFRLVDDYYRFALYDPIATKNKIIKRNTPLCKFAEYVDSLVWVAPPDREINSCDISQLQIGN